MKRTLVLAAALAFTIAACGDDGPTGPGGGGGNEMEATVGGVPFDPPSVAVQGTYTPAQGLVNIAGSHTSGGITTLVTINVLNVEGTGTYQLNPNFAGSFGQVSTTDGSVNGTSAWSTILSPGTGSITFTTLTTERAAGTFQFTGQASPGTAATGQKSVTSGTFDIEF